MPRFLTHITLDLKSNLIAVLGGRSTSRELNGVVNLCLALASELLSRKWGSRRLQERLGLSEVDLAFDCIGDLFGRDEAGRFRQIEAYFGGIETGVLDDAELLVLLRRLVYSRVNHALFRLYQDLDPAFSRILRNVKLAQDAIKQFDERDRFGETCIVPVLCDAQEHLPPIEQADLEAALSAECNGTESVPVMMGKIALLLRRQEECARWIPIMTVASTIRAVYEIKNRPQLQPFTEVDPFAADDMAASVCEACSAVKGSMRASYLGRRKSLPRSTNPTFR